MKGQDERTKKVLLASQKNEITEFYIYRKLSASMKGRYNRVILNKVANDEHRHYNIWKKYTGVDVRPSRYRIWKYYLISRIFGITFGIRLMENGEKKAQEAYANLLKGIPESESVVHDEMRHERKLVEMIDDDRLKYTGSIVRGLNDALVELTGALAGFSFAFKNPSLIAIIGLITGISGALSMSASEYLACKSEECYKHPVKASAYSAVAFFMTVLFLIAPYFIFDNVYHSLPVTVITAVVLISIFSYYISVARGLSFRKRFLEMAAISLGIAALSFGIGVAIRSVFHIDV